MRRVAPGRGVPAPAQDIAATRRLLEHLYDRLSCTQPDISGVRAIGASSQAGLAAAGVGRVLTHGAASRTRGPLARHPVGLRRQWLGAPPPKQSVWGEAAALASERDAT